ncbi:hypothetical protein [Frigoriglobus tundricola]|uniref:Uncharacterized protein n=1 Tax=Frigoriglobus tundricola TaxID=2774151 RepID=A0A6M5YT39_9BACT|nr:hypothetical protein [Frigoriglobus tundricola]QJW96604.1 hypothetical protein FTUN_4161 [Frigoriglobus tundricola]
MIRMSVVCAGCLLPVLTGCGSLRHLTGTDTATGPTANAPAPAPRPEVNPIANTAWDTFHERQPQPSSNEFHEGFLAGYTDYLNRGPAALPPTPPSSYTASKKPPAPGSDDLVSDYHHGFRYGVYAAMVGKRSGDSVASASPAKAAPAASAGKPGPDSAATVPAKLPAAVTVSKPSPDSTLSPPAATVDVRSTDSVNAAPPAVSVSKPSTDSGPSAPVVKNPAPDTHPNFNTPAVTQWNTFPLPTRAPKGADQPPANVGSSRPATESARTAPQTSSAAPRTPTESGRTVPPLPKPELPIIPPFNPDLSGAEKLVPLPVPTDPGRFPLPSPPLPAPDTKVIPLPVPSGEPRNVLPPIREPLSLPVPVVKTDLPIPLVPTPPVSGASVPTPALPTSGTPLPPILGTIPPVPFRPTIDEK